MAEPEGLIGRIRQLRRSADPAREVRNAGVDTPPRDELRALEVRVRHLEQLVQGLQDSVHRESSRHAKMIAELEARLEPGALGRALSKDARERGL